MFYRSHEKPFPTFLVKPSVRREWWNFTSLLILPSNNMWWLSPCCSNIAPLRSDLIRPDRGCQPLGAAGSCFRNANSSNTRCDAWNMKTEARRGLWWAPGTCQHGHAPGTWDSANQRPDCGALWPIRVRSGVWSRGMRSDISHTERIIRSRLLRIIAALIRDNGEL